MPALTPAMVQLLETFAQAFTRPTFANALVLLFGVILAPGRRTVSAALRAMGLAQDRHFGTYHRVLNRAVWSPLVRSRLLLGLVVLTFLPAEMPVLLVIDETLERRRGKRIVYKGRFRDAVRSRGPHVVTSEGVHWLCVAVLVPVPWSQRSWALPFLTVPTLAPATSAKLGKRHRTVVDRATVLVRLVRRWLPDREIVLVGDSGYAAVNLGHAARRAHVALVSRLRLDAALYAEPEVQPPGKRGPKPKKGTRQPSFKARVADRDTDWATVAVTWYGGQVVDREVVTGTALWHRVGTPPLPLRWLLVRDPDQQERLLALFSTDLTMTAQQILQTYLLRWNIAVTFEELRACLGFETQRGWRTATIARTTPCLFGSFSLGVLLAHALHPQHLPTRQAAWYPKDAATFADALAALRRQLWSAGINHTPQPASDQPNSPDHFLASLLEAACYAA